MILKGWQIELKFDYENLKFSSPLRSIAAQKGGLTT